ncbi:unnamed protein product [Diatraea saccharalis]|uniref:LIM zinc-binding domain-containing protein n=1 Tax=Diatraea saccharalis TaxID=40085 RepID=A0A9N9WHK7_9NEOP|nr:unnamed protein product [Diatraea saccharalis]
MKYEIRCTYQLFCERRTPQQASGGSPGLPHMLAMDVTKEARASPLPASAQQPSASSAQPPQPQICAGCSKVITERYLLKALDQLWHEDCLKCGCCDCRLGEVGHTLYTRANLILCKRDYLRFCVGDRFYLCENKILCEYDYEERLVFANMAYNPPPLAHLKRQTTHLPPPPTSNAMGAMINGSSRAGDLNNNMSGASPAPFAPPPHLKPLGLSASS